MSYLVQLITVWTEKGRTWKKLKSVGDKDKNPAFSSGRTGICTWILIEAEKLYI
jgi:hypothetical protein